MAAWFQTPGVVCMLTEIYRTVGSEWIAYGKRRGELFEVEVSDEKEYAQLIGDLEEEIGDSQRQQQRARVDAIVADAIGS